MNRSHPGNPLIIPSTVILKVESCFIAFIDGYNLLHPRVPIMNFSTVSSHSTHFTPFVALLLSPKADQSQNRVICHYVILSQCREAEQNSGQRWNKLAVWTGLNTWLNGSWTSFFYLHFTFHPKGWPAGCFRLVRCWNYNQSPHMQICYKTYRIYRHSHLDPLTQTSFIYMWHVEKLLYFN